MFNYEIEGTGSVNAILKHSSRAPVLHPQNHCSSFSALQSMSANMLSCISELATDHHMCYLDLS